MSLCKILSDIKLNVAEYEKQSNNIIKEISDELSEITDKDAVAITARMAECVKKMDESLRHVIERKERHFAALHLKKRCEE